MKVLILRRSGLHRPFLWLARIAWVLLLALVISLLVVNAPANVYHARLEYQVQKALRVILSFTSLQSFAEWLVAARWLVFTIYFAVALIIARRRWDNWFALAVSAALLMLGWGYVMRGDHTTWLYPRLLEPLAQRLHLILSQSTILSLVMLFFLFPDGRFVSRWHKWLALLCVGVTALFYFADQNHLAWPALQPFLARYAWDTWISLLLISLLAALGGQVYRYRRLATPTQQQQMKWVLIGLAAMLSVPLLAWPLEDEGGAWGSLASIGIELVASGFLPVAIGFSILRYRLWDVDLIINRTLVYGTLTAMILALYGLSVGLASALVPARNLWLLSTLALGVVFLIVAPLRARLQSLADRWLPPFRLEVFEEVPLQPPAITWPLRLAQLAWIASFVFLFRQAVIRLTTQPDLILATGGDYLVRESLKLPWVSADLLIPYILALRIGVTAVFWFTAGLIFWRKRQDGFALAVSYIFMLTPFGLVLSGVDTPVANFLSLLGMITVALFPFFFPDGRLIPSSFGWRATLIGALLLTPFLVYPITRAAFREYTPGEWAYISAMITWLVLMAFGLASQVYRYRSISTPVQRQQTKWVLLGLGIQFSWISWLVLWLSGVLARIGFSEPLIALVMLHLTILGLAALPVTISISILRYRLWDIDLMINRALVFGGLTLLVATAYVITVGILGVLFQAGNNLLLSILATGMIAILFHPLRQRLQHTINRLMYGERDDPATILSRLGARLANTAIPGEMLPTIVETIALALKLPYVAILQEDGGGMSEGPVAEYGRSTPDAASFPLVYQGQAIGQLLAAPRAPGETFTPAERRLLENIAQQAGAAVYAAQLTRHLQHSRQQLITSREEERRRIHRDLHDGLGPQLATMSLKLDAARNYLANDPGTAEQLLQELIVQVQDAIQDVRGLVYDLRPPALDQLGLVPALREYAAQNSANGLHICVEAAEPLPSLPAAVEVAAYRIALEAMTNAVRHARASQCSVTLCAEEALCLEIMDNGMGFPAQPSSGVGLASIRERTAELGGMFNLQSTPGAGTHLSIRLPLNT